MKEDVREPQEARLVRGFVARYAFAFLSAIFGVLLTVLLLALQQCLGAVLSALFTVQFTFLVAWVEKSNVRMQAMADVVTSTPAEIRTALGKRVHDCFSAFNPKFDLITRYLIQEQHEIHVHVVSFVERSLKRILDQGFVEARVEFPTYQEEAIGFVRGLYESKQCADIWTVCLYCPVEYLYMWIDRRDHRNSAGHLPVFDGVMSDGQTIRPLGHNETATSFVRVIYLDESRMDALLDPETATSLRANPDSDELALTTAFAFLWFMFYNRLIDLHWAWIESMPYQGSNRRFAEDFMIFNNRQFLRYDKEYKSLLLCWNPSEDLFADARTMFDQASELFTALISPPLPASATTEERERSAKIKRCHRRQVFGLLRNCGSVFSRDAPKRARVRKVFVEMTRRLLDVTLWPDGPAIADQKGAELFRAAIAATKQRISEDEGSFENIELVLREHLNNLSSGDLNILYQFLDSNHFVAVAKELFSLLQDQTLKEELVPGMQDRPETH